MQSSLRKVATLIAWALCAAPMTLGSPMSAGAQELSAPDAPMIGVSIAGDGQATVSWVAPVSNGALPITLYVVTPYIGYFPLQPVTFGSTATTQTVTGLTNGTTYRFRVQAINALGTSEFSRVTNPVTPSPFEVGGLWHADADADEDSGDHTLLFRKEVTSGDWTRLAIVNDPLGLHGEVYRANLTAADIDTGDDRAEFRGAYAGDGSTKVKLAVAGAQNVWIGWRSMFGGDVLIDPSHSNDGNYMQLKGDSSCGGPAVGMTIKYGHLTLRSEMYLPDTDGVAWNGPAMASLLDGQWHDFLLHFQLAKDNTGYLEVTMDGVPQTMTNGDTRIYFPTVCPDDTYVYPKMGVYAMDAGIGAGPVHWIESPRIGVTSASAVPR